MKEGKKLFRGSLFGFQKADVFNYIEDLNARLSDAEESLVEVTDNSRAKEEKLRALLSKAEDSVAKLTAERDEIFSKVGGGKAEIAALGSELTKARYQSEQDHLRILEYAKKLHDYEDQMVLLREKADKYDRQMGKISEVMVLVRSEADKILADAKAEAETVREQTKLEVSRTNALIDKFKENYTTAKSVFNSSIDNMRGIFDSTYDKVGSTVHTVEEIAARQGIPADRDEDDDEI